ncbi:MAG: N-6 DNA methylase [Phycisphaerae bacterium]|nr:N-6 DNA methylase [Phycisphaerae bacterium]
MQNAKQYLREIGETYAAGNATEHSYRPALKTLVESFAKGVTAMNEPKREKCGAPDLIVTRKNAPIGYIECKDIGVSLDHAEKSDQLERYFPSLENLILTDYLEFRYYVSGQPQMHVLLARVDPKGKVRLVQGADAALAQLFDVFLAAGPKTINTPKELAGRMAKVAQVIRDAIEKAFALEAQAGTLHGELESFRQTILRDITPSQFADMYAQTVCYGMFSARVNVPDQKAATFTREHAAYDLPATNPFLREVFEYIAGTRLDSSILWAVDLLGEILRHCDMNEILKNFGKASRKEDPVVHFYETFLAAYDPTLRKTRGVYYTPEPVVSYIVRSIDAILKHDFGCTDGLADSNKITVEFPDTSKKSGKAKQEVHRVQILDPAAGTGTFLYETVRIIHDALRPNRGIWAGDRGYVAQHLLPRLYGFELMMAPYAVAHLKLGWLLKETGYNFPNGQRLGVYLTNTLEEAEIVAGPLLALANQIAREANAASRVKTDCPIMVVLGNPPYSGHSANDNQWSKDLIHKKLSGRDGAPSYFECDGNPLGERNPKWLNDDYVKFIRFGQYRIELTGYGVLGFITNHGYLDNPTFRGMRQSLMQTFDDIYILDLHGNTKKKEVCPDGSKDQNVFDIQQGVAIGLFVKRKNGQAKKPAEVFHYELWGIRQLKYEWLNTTYGASDTPWEPLSPDKPFYLFVPQDTALLSEYQEGPSIADAMPVGNVGIVTARDQLTVHWTGDEVMLAVRDFATLAPETARDKYGLGKDVRDWRVEWAQKDLNATACSDSFLTPILYRCFDTRFTYFTGKTKGFHCMPRGEFMRHMLAGENLALLVSRQVADEYRHVFCTRLIANFNAIDTAGRFGSGPMYPLYVYLDEGKMLEDSRWPPGRNGRRPNLRPEFVERFVAKLGLRFVSDGAGDLKRTFGPEDIFHYAYAVFHSPEYRSRYGEFLKTDFPRLPLTSDEKLFAQLCELGAELIGLHLLERVQTPQATYPQQGDSVVERTGKKAYKVPTDQAPGRVYVNDAQYFENVPPEVWEFHVGGYQVCEKWLKDRKGRTLSYDDIETYRKITEAIRQTIRLMGEIDDTIPSWPLP